MEINSLVSSGLAAFQAGQQRIDTAAEAVAGASLPVADASQAVNEVVELTEQLVQMKVGEHAAKAGARMIQSADEALGTLINTIA